MKRNFAGALFLILTICVSAFAEEMSLEKYLSQFDYNARKDMKIDSETLINQIKKGNIQLIDIRFKEEFDAWNMGFSTHIPLDELPVRLNELDKDKIIVTACPHKDRAILGMVFLRTKGFRSKYLTDGLVGLAEHLRGETARDFNKQFNK